MEISFHALPKIRKILALKHRPGSLQPPRKDPKTQGSSRLLNKPTRKKALPLPDDSASERLLGAEQGMGAEDACPACTKFWGQSSREIEINLKRT